MENSKTNENTLLFSEEFGELTIQELETELEAFSAAAALEAAARC